MTETCTRCGGPGPVRPVRLHRHIGLVVIFLHTQVRGVMCRTCLDRSFGDTFWVTLFLGWWGLISFFATLFFLPYDLVHYLQTRASYNASDASGRYGMAIGAGVLSLGLVLCGGPLLLISGLEHRSC